MDSIQKFYYKTVKYDLVNKYMIKKSKEIPKIDRIVLNFNCWLKPGNISALSACLLALETITHQSGVLTKALFPQISLRLRKGFPIGCKLTLKKKNQYNFFSKIIREVYPSSKTFAPLRANNSNNAFSFNIRELFSFPELEENYNLFKDLEPLNVTIITVNTPSVHELEFLLTSLKVPIEKH
jgi:large subunit ribosomal protein L5